MALVLTKADDITIGPPDAEGGRMNPVDVIAEPERAPVTGPEAARP